jgi:hypothetical protein
MGGIRTVPKFIDAVATSVDVLQSVSSGLTLTAPGRAIEVVA